MLEFLLRFSTTFSKYTWAKNGGETTHSLGAIGWDEW